MKLSDIYQLNSGTYEGDGVNYIIEPHCITVLFSDFHTRMSSSDDIVDISIPEIHNVVEYDDDFLMKTCSAFNREFETPEERFAGAINFLASTSGLPDVESMTKTFLFSGGRPVNAFKLRTAGPWGGHGPVVNRGGWGQMEGYVNSFHPLGTTIDDLLEIARRNHLVPPWEKSIEDSLTSQHNDKDDDLSKYNLKWEDRIKQKNLLRLRRMLADRAKRKQQEENRDPEYLRTEDEEINIKGYIPPEERLDSRREVKDEDYTVGRIEEWTPEWYSRLRTLRRASRKCSMRKLAQTVGTSPMRHDVFYTGYYPNRRNRPIDEPKTPLNSGGFAWTSSGYTKDDQSLDNLVEQGVGRISNKHDIDDKYTTSTQYQSPYATDTLVDATEGLREQNSPSSLLPTENIQAVRHDSMFDEQRVEQYIDEYIQELEAQLTDEQKDKVKRRMMKQMLGKDGKGGTESSLWPSKPHSQQREESDDYRKEMSQTNKRFLL